MKILVCLSFVFAASLALAADPKGVSTGEAPEWMKFTTPGENHKAMNDLTGKFSYTMRWWAKPDVKAEESKGTSTAKWIMNGRFVQQDVKGKAMGQAFNGMGITGYDNLKEEFQSVWFDDMSTGMMWGSGKMDPAGKTISQTGTTSDPMKGEKNAWYRTDLTVISKNEHKFEMYSKDTAGKEFKAMEIEYKRTK